MEAWVPLFKIFLNSPSPESEASLWLNRSFNATSSATTISTTTSSFVSLLMKPLDAIVVAESSSSSPSTRKVMFIQTMPNMVQARVLSFLAVERQRFSLRDLRILARTVLSSKLGLDFWVERAARNLFDVLSDSSYEWISCLSLDSGEEEGEEERVVDEFESVPSWLKDDASPASDWLPWLPLSSEDLMSSRTSFGDSEKNVNSLCKNRNRDVEELVDEVMVEVDRPTNDTLELEVLNQATSLKARIVNFESNSKAVDLANEIQKLCYDHKQGDRSLVILGLIEPWIADDETASVLITHLSNGSDEKEEPIWPSQVLCAIVLPKLFVLEEPASRVLLAATIDYCKVHSKAAEYSLLLPLILRREGINNPICDLVTRIVKECLHTAHVSALCQKLLCGGNDDRRVLCLPCHRCLVSDELVWTESLFNLFQNILNHNVCLTQDSVDCIVSQVHNSSEKFSKSLKFGHFLLCLVNKCSPLLRSHKLTLIEAAGKTHTLVTKSTLSKLASI